MDSLLHQVTEIDIRQVARDLGFDIIQNRRMLCPFHVEDSPSLVFYPPPENNFHCFGCGKHGDVVNLYADVCQLNFKTALEELASRYIPNYDIKQQITKHKPAIKGILPEKVIENKPFVFNEVFSKIYGDLRKFCTEQPNTESTKKATEYLKTRGIDDWTIKHFKLFFIKNYSLTNEFLKNNYPIEDLKSSGLMNDKGNLLFYVHPIIIPYFNEGKIVYLQGRTIGEPPTGTNKYQFLTSIPRTIFNIDSIKNLRSNSKVYMTEGAFDCMTLVKNGLPAVSLGSAKGFKKEWAKHFKRFEVLISFDNDSAGIKGAEDLLNELLSLGIYANKRTWNKDFKDINDYFVRS